MIQYRHEYKHYLSYADCLVIRQRLRAVMKPDSHAGASGSYKIRSLYFDTPTDKALQEKINGVCDREKFRIRCYDSNYDFIRLEKKIKKGNLGYKLSTALSLEETENIISGEIDWMPARKDALLTELHQKMCLDILKPKVIVDYTREPFIYSAGNVRITLDYDIRTSLHQINLLDPDLPMIPASPGNVLLEVKYDNYLPDMIRDIIQLQYRGENAFSKYAACRLIFE